MITDDFNVILKQGMKCTLQKEVISDDIQICRFNLQWDDINYRDNDAFEIIWEVPMIDISYTWSPMNGNCHSVLPNWSKCYDSMISFNAPAGISYNGKSESKYSWALSECKKLVQTRVGVVEKNGMLECFVKLPLKQFENIRESALEIYISKKEEPIADAAQRISDWWESIGMKPCFVPDSAKDPLYSFWYSYHQDLTAQVIEEECARAKELGFDTCIVDDGWQTDDTNGGYSYCGDWEVGLTKIPDMKEHVKRVQKMGMKYLLWFSVPFMGKNAKKFNDFKDMTLNDAENGAVVLDPRYKKVREFLLGIYKKALQEWNLDGFKLDFIDSWWDDDSNAPYNPDMDIPVLQDAVDTFMTSVYNELSSIKNDILIEFRQQYIGPNMRRFGNMFRVADCPNDILTNRRGSLDLRMMMGNSAVHSDMLMWNKDELPEVAALQIVSVLFSALQYSARLENMSAAMKKMSMFWVGFMKEHKNLLLEGRLTVYEPHLNYTWVKATTDDECIAAVYAIDKCVKPDLKGRMYIANGCAGDRVIVDMTGEFNVVVYNCYGEKTTEYDEKFNGITSIAVPVGGLAILRRNN